MVFLGKFFYKLPDREGEGRVVLKDLVRGSNLTKVDLDFGSDQEAVLWLNDRTVKMEIKICQKLPGAVSCFAIHTSRLNAISMQGRSFDGTPLPEREELDQEMIGIIFGQLQKYLPIEIREPLEAWPII
jgi:hypothetical protein